MVFALCGGDARQAELARLLLEDGHEVRSWALERAELPGGAKVCASAAEALEGADCLLLPMPVSAKSGLLNAPLSEGTHCLGEVFAAAEPGMPVCGGAIAPEARAVAEGRGLRLHDYGKREELLAANAVATAEGAVGVLLSETAWALCGRKALVTGWGRVARALAPRLRGLGMEVTMAARKPGDRAWAAAWGFHTADTERLAEALRGCSAVVNTVPALLLTAARLAELEPEALVLDLASAPGGTDFEAARAFGLRALTAPGLPGKWAPLTAAQAIRDAVYNILEV